MLYSEDSIVVRYRQSRRSAIRDGIGDTNELSLPTALPDGFQSIFSRTIAGDLMEMYLNDMKYSPPPGCAINLLFEPMKQYIKTFMELTIIEDPYFGPNKIAQILVEDKNKDIALLQVRGLEKTATYLDEFAFGSMIKVNEPGLLATSSHGKEVSEIALYIHNLENITQIGKKKDLCRYCKTENASKRCSKCKRRYCSEECQAADWEIQKHGMICKTPIPY